MRKKILFLMTMLLIADIVYSAFQHYHGVLDGDMAAIILPAPRYQQVLTDPFGIQSLSAGSKYGGVNRYFAHISMYSAYRSLPFGLQQFVDPVTSLYLTNGICKTLIQVLLVYLIASYAAGERRINNFKLLTAALLVIPFFQVNSFNGDMSIIDASPTYAFFYAFGFALMMILYRPLFFRALNYCPTALSNGNIILWLLLAIVGAFHGPLNNPVCILIFALALSYQGVAYSLQGSWIIKYNKIKMPLIRRNVLCLLLFSFSLSIYSVIIGKNNSENFWNDSVGLIDRFRLLPHGLMQFFWEIPGIVILLLLVLLNLLLTAFQESSVRRQHILLLALGMAVFSTLYLLLLPLGGYRPYRPFIFKKDLAIPIVVLLLIIYASSALYLLDVLKSRRLHLYIALIASVLVGFSWIDKPGRGKDLCQKQAIYSMQASTSAIVRIDSNCQVLTWENVHNFKDSKVSVDALRFWRILGRDMYYYQ